MIIFIEKVCRIKKKPIFVALIYYFITFISNISMKKIILVAAVATFGLGLASCKKDYVCTYKDGSGATQTQNYPGLTKTSKTAAESQCALLGGSFAKK